jgi:protease II
MNAPEVSPDSSNWTEFVAQEPGHYLSHFEIFETFVAVDIEGEDGMRIRAFGFPYGREIPVPRPAEIGVASGRLEQTRRRDHGMANRACP